VQGRPGDDLRDELARPVSLAHLKRVRNPVGLVFGALHHDGDVPLGIQTGAEYLDASDGTVETSMVECEGLVGRFDVLGHDREL
jgi:hypothetical protein